MCESGVVFEGDPIVEVESDSDVRAIVIDMPTSEVQPVVIVPVIETVVLHEETPTSLHCDSSHRAGEHNITVLKTVDRSLRSQKTIFAKICNFISPEVGKEYLHSWQKRALDVVIAIPASLVAVPTSIVLGLIQHFSDGESAFFWQTRLKTDLQTPFQMPKIRSMRSDADALDIEEKASLMANIQPDKDPRISGIGRLLRVTDADELPQIVQVLIGIQSIVGPRAVSLEVLSFMEDKLPEDIFREWISNYIKNKRTGIVGANQIFNRNRKDNLGRTHYDNFYGNHASLGFDLYILWRTFLKLSRLEKLL